MGLGVLNNLSAIYAENNLNNTNNSLQTVLPQLSSGSKINSGADDAAGLSLVNGLEANQTALTQSETNATEGVGLLQVADGALSQVTSLLDRAITLATEASNGTLNSTQEDAADQEYQSILAEINNIGSTTTYNQEQVFDGVTVAIYTGDSSAAGSSIDDVNIRALNSSSVGDTDGAMSYNSGASNVFIDLSDAGINASASDISGAITDSSTAGGTGVLGISADNNGTGGIATISYSDAPGAILTGTDLTNQTDAQSALNDLNLAISDVSALDGYIGAQINTLNSIGQVISTQQENVVSAQNAIQATDYASATSNMSKYEILSQTGIAALAQANSVQQEVTKLLQ
jgi:flagellin